MLVNRDPFARQELHKESAGKGTCDWCGQEKRIVWQYYIEEDSIEPNRNNIKGVFCNKQCMEDYHG